MRQQMPQHCAVILGDMLEFSQSGNDLHVGLIPAMVNNQTDLMFGAEKFIADMVYDLPRELRDIYMLPHQGPYLCHDS